MSILQRPLFRAGGGGANKFPDLSGDGKVTQKDILIGRGVLPRKMQEGGMAAMMPPTAPVSSLMMPDAAAMPPEMPMQEPLDGPAQDMLMAREEGEKLGLEYLAATMDGIDDAANTEQLINAIRGNDRPLADRVSELATFVGEADARQTPESVLTMVQPTIMMSEEGAIDSGVGGLIRQVLGAAEVEDEMAEGIGSLMVQGQPEPIPSPQQFAEGGAVKKFEEGGGAFKDYFDEYLPLYENLLRDSEGNLDKDRGLALARAGLQLASGRDAQGRNIAGSGFLSNLASAGETLIGDVSALDREQRKQDTAARTLALQSAFATQSAKQESERRLAELKTESQLRRQENLINLMAGPPKIIGQRETIFGTAINVYGVPSVDEKRNVTYIPISMKQATELGLPTVDTPEGQALTSTSPVPIGKNPDQSRIVTAQPELAAAYAANEMTPEQQSTFEDQIQNAFPFEREKGSVVFTTPLSSGVVETVALRLAQGHQVGLRTEYLDEIRRVAAETAERDPTFLGGMYKFADDPESEAGKRLRAAGLIIDEPSIQDTLADVKSQIADLDIAEGVGPWRAAVRNIGGSIDSVVNLLTLGEFDPGFSTGTENIEVFETLGGLATQNLLLLLDAIEGKENVRLEEELRSTITDVRDRQYATPAQLLQSFQASKRYNTQVQNLLEVESQKPDISAEESKTIRDSLIKIGAIGSELDVVIAKLGDIVGEPSNTGQRANLSSFRRRQQPQR